MPRDARIGDTGSHGGVIVTGSPNTIDEGRQSARIGDIYMCALHGPNPIVSGSPQTVVNNRKNARISSVTACGAVIVSGAAKCITD
jgi:uncharacterized Zn-binding protein involved in type VI secretion